MDLRDSRSMIHDAFAAAVAFHLANWQLLAIGTFPWLAIAATTIFFEPDWPRRLMARIAPRPLARTEPAVVETRALSTVGFPLLVAYAVVQLVVPLRHLLYPGDVDWTTQGNRFSWRMMLQSRQGYVNLVVHAGADTLRVKSSDYAPGWQRRMLLRDPGMVIQLARHVADDVRRRSRGDVRVYGDVTLSLNGGAMRRFVNPSVDLAAESPTVWSASRVLLDPDAEDLALRPR